MCEQSSITLTFKNPERLDSCATKYDKLVEQIFLNYQLFNKFNLKMYILCINIGKLKINKIIIKCSNSQEYSKNNAFCINSDPSYNHLKLSLAEWTMFMHSPKCSKYMS